MGKCIPFLISILLGMVGYFSNDQTELGIIKLCTNIFYFSYFRTKVASTHGNHNVYVSELASGKHVRILKGHPRTPWCIAFHPSHPQLIGSGCLGGQVRVWDISSVSFGTF